MASDQPSVIYWDSSAILSIFFEDTHTAEARQYLVNGSISHLISTLAWCETFAVVSRLQRQRVLEDDLAARTLNTVRQGPWKRLNIGPKWSIARRLATKWPLRGADLWHLATAKTLQQEIPEIFLLTFDKRLHTAAKGEGMGREAIGNRQ